MSLMSVVLVSITVSRKYIWKEMIAAAVAL